MSIHRRVVTDELVELFKVEARRWVDEHIGVHRDDDRTDEEVDALARAFADHFVGGFNAAVDICVETIRTTGATRTSGEADRR